MRKFITILLTAAVLTSAWIAMGGDPTAAVPSSFKILMDQKHPGRLSLSGSDSLGNAVNPRDHQIYIYQGFGERSYSNVFMPGHRSAISLRAYTNCGENVALGVVLKTGWVNATTKGGMLADTLSIKALTAVADTLWIEAAGTYYKAFTATWGPHAVLEFLPNYYQGADTTLNRVETYVEGVYMWDRY